MPTSSNTTPAAVPDEAPLRGLVNVGPTIAATLAGIGITTVGELRRATPTGVYRQLQTAAPDKPLPRCYYLYALQGALDGRCWRDLPDAVKQALQQQVRQ